MGKGTPKTSLIQPGDELNGYKVGEILSHKGGMSVLYLVSHPNPLLAAVPLVLKVPKDDTQDMFARLEREAHSLSLLTNCRYVVRIHDSGHAPNGMPYLVMERLAGEDLDKVMRREKRLELKRAVEIAMQASLGLHACHCVGVHHRDLKPANLFLHREDDTVETVKLIDFGISHTGTGPAITTAEQRSGTRRYMAPEQAAGSDHDTAADQFTLAAVLFEALAGQLPWPLPDPRNGEHERRVARGDFKRLREVFPDAPEALEIVIMRALSPNSSARFASAYDFGRELARFASSSGQALFERYTPHRGGQIKVTMMGAGLSEAVTTSRATPAAGAAASPGEPDDAGEYATVASAIARQRAALRRPRLGKALGLVSVAALGALGAWRWLPYEQWAHRTGAAGAGGGAGAVATSASPRPAGLGVPAPLPIGADAGRVAKEIRVEALEQSGPSPAEPEAPAAAGATNVTAAAASATLPMTEAATPRPPEAEPKAGGRKAVPPAGVRWKNGRLYSGGRTAIVE